MAIPGSLTMECEFALPDSARVRLISRFTSMLRPLQSPHFSKSARISTCASWISSRGLVPVLHSPHKQLTWLVMRHPILNLCVLLRHMFNRGGKQANCHFRTCLMKPRMRSVTYWIIHQRVHLEIGVGAKIRVTKFRVVDGISVNTRDLHRFHSTGTDIGPGPGLGVDPVTKCIGC